MDLLVDIQPLQSATSRKRGIGRYGRSLLKALRATRPAWRIRCVQNARLDSPNPSVGSGEVTLTFKPPLPIGSVSRLVNEQYYADWLTSQAADALLLLNFFDGQIVLPRFLGHRPRIFGVVHDLVPILYHRQYLYRPEEFAQYAYGLRRLMQSDGLLTNSEATAADLRRLVGEDLPPITAIGGATDLALGPDEPPRLEKLGAPLPARLQLSREFILYVGGWDWRKNLTGAMRALATLPPPYRQQVDLVICCVLASAEQQALEMLAEELGISRCLHFTGYVSDQDLRSLYELCRVFFFPSFYEGLGLPVLEALQCGAPVVAANTSAIPEYAGAVCWLTDPTDPKSMAQALIAALDEPRELRRTERQHHAARFTWERVAERACRALERERPSSQCRTKRRQLAWVSPLPPTTTGIADYSAELLDELAAHYDLDLVVDPSEPAVAEKTATRHRILLPREAASRHTDRPYDLFVLHIGNSHYHAYMLELLQQVRGLVVLHDFTLSGLVHSAARAGYWPNGKMQALAAERRQVTIREPAAADENVEQQSPLNRWLFRLADGIIVHSAWTWRQTRQRTDVPVARIRHGIRLPALEHREKLRARMGLASDRFVIASLGFAGPASRLPSLLRAVAASPQRMRQSAEVVVVGEIRPAFRDELVRLADCLGIASRIRFAGRVSLGELTDYARAADVCVQLRHPHRGETSGVLLREMAAGAACIISERGPMAEVPDGAAVRIPTDGTEVTELTAALVRLFDDPADRQSLGQQARQYVGHYHSWRRAAEHYGAMIELTIARRHAMQGTWAAAVSSALAASASAPIGLEDLAAWVDLRLRGQIAREYGVAPHRRLPGPPPTDHLMGPARERTGTSEGPVSASSGSNA